MYSFPDRVFFKHNSKGTGVCCVLKAFDALSEGNLRFQIPPRRKAGVKRRTSHEPNRMLMKLNEGEQRVFLICIRFGSCEVRRSTRA